MKKFSAALLLLTMLVTNSLILPTASANQLGFMFIRDANSNGLIDTVLIEVERGTAASADPVAFDTAGWAVSYDDGLVSSTANSIVVSSVSIVPPSLSSSVFAVRLSLDETTIPRLNTDAGNFDVTYTQQNTANSGTFFDATNGIELVGIDSSAVELDNAPPLILTVEYQDTDVDGHLDTLFLALTEPIIVLNNTGNTNATFDALSVNGPFNVTGYSEVSSTDRGISYLYLDIEQTSALSVGTTGETPGVFYSGGFAPKNYRIVDAASLEVSLVDIASRLDVAYPIVLSVSGLESTVADVTPVDVFIVASEPVSRPTVAVSDGTLGTLLTCASSTVTASTISNCYKISYTAPANFSGTATFDVTGIADARNLLMSSVNTTSFLVDTTGGASPGNTGGGTTPTPPVVVSVAALDGQTNLQDIRTAREYTVVITFNEDITNTPQVVLQSLGSSGIAFQVIEDCADSDAKTFCFPVTIANDATDRLQVIISGATDDEGTAMVSNSSTMIQYDTTIPAQSGGTEPEVTEPEVTEPDPEPEATPEVVAPAASGGGGGGGGGGFFRRKDKVASVEVASEDTVYCSDISGHWAEETIKTLIDLGAFEPTAEGNCDPDTEFHRAGMTRISLNLFGPKVDFDAELAEKPFDDVELDHPYAKDIATGKEAGIVRGYGIDGKDFKPDVVPSRAEGLQILMEAAGYKFPRLLPNTIDNNSDHEFVSLMKKFSDILWADAWYNHYVKWATENAVIEGYANGTVKPDQAITRAEAAKMALFIYNLKNGK